ncbi:hypothetical protein HELRODRAFT_183272 [Helobdella robusta]|uniref:Uncharacterized protein n=1 Tax=Helobdella robusta TaxID=6412 RepID=T1FJE3_HELRO|nr:hypothetical protein HELRODRAFT_183272 [Helobdella robusta]ESO11389.1 hypothetical protein HELRODRAFT_183272 [Helobdella robusta]
MKTKLRNSKIHLYLKLENLADNCFHVIKRAFETAIGEYYVKYLTKAGYSGREPMELSKIKYEGGTLSNYEEPVFCHLLESYKRFMDDFQQTLPSILIKELQKYKTLKDRDMVNDGAIINTRDKVKSLTKAYSEKKYKLYPHYIMKYALESRGLPYDETKANVHMSFVRQYFDLCRGIIRGVPVVIFQVLDQEASLFIRRQPYQEDPQILLDVMEYEREFAQYKVVLDSEVKRLRSNHCQAAAKKIYHRPASILMYEISDRLESIYCMYLAQAD